MFVPKVSGTDEDLQLSIEQVDHGTQCTKCAHRVVAKRETLAVDFVSHPLRDGEANAVYLDVKKNAETVADLPLEFAFLAQKPVKRVMNRDDALVAGIINRILAVPATTFSALPLQVTP